MTDDRHPHWCGRDDSCDVGQPGGEHRGPLEVVDYGGGRVEIELAQPAGGEAVLVLRDWRGDHWIAPAVELKLPLDRAGVVVMHAFGLLRKIGVIAPSDPA